MAKEVWMRGERRSTDEAEPELWEGDPHGLTAGSGADGAVALLQVLGENVARLLRRRGESRTRRRLGASHGYLERIDDLEAPKWPNWPQFLLPGGPGQAPPPTALLNRHWLFVSRPAKLFCAPIWCKDNNTGLKITEVTGSGTVGKRCARRSAAWRITSRRPSGGHW